VDKLSVGNLLEMLGQGRVMMGGGFIAALGLVAIAFMGWWPLALLSFVGLGLGFYLLHGSIQVYMTELAPEARGSAAALHSSSFFLGQALGPIVYGLGFAVVGPRATLLVAAAVVALIGATAVRLLRAHPSQSS
jgi:MFS transporter, DHA1 family, inner membrane transport protein